jgi:nicotinate-nucleotide adenylyltransferase
MTIALFPGTFNPIHIGHLMIAETACLQFNLDEIHFVISPNPPNKIGSKEMIQIDDRIKLLKAALASNSKFKIDLRETNRSGPSYTIDTILEVKREQKSDQKVRLILGLDAFLSLPSWNQAKELGRLCHFLVAPRPGWNKEEVEDALSWFHNDLSWDLIASPSLAISSSQIRERKHNKQSYRYLLPEKVFELYT